MNLLTNGESSAKLAKGQGQAGYMTSVLYLKPADSSGLGINICPAASAGCRAACLNTAGRGADWMVDKRTGTNLVQAARQRRTEFLIRDRVGFVSQLRSEINKLIKRANRKGMKLAIRLNGTSDLDWSEIYTAYPDIQFYEYTKRPDLALKLRALKNVSVTFSLSEANLPVAVRLLERGINVAVVFDIKRGKSLPGEFHGYQVLDGDLSDNRFLDPIAPKGFVVGLRAKGKAIRDTSGFVQSCANRGAGTQAAA